MSALADLLKRWGDVLKRQTQWEGTEAVEATALKLHFHQVEKARRTDADWLLEQAEMFHRNPQVCRTYCEVYAHLMGYTEEDGMKVFQSIANGIRLTERQQSALLFVLSKDPEVVSTRSVAKHLNTTQQRAGDALDSLARKSLIERERWKGNWLTDFGRDWAKTLEMKSEVD